MEEAVLLSTSWGTLHHPGGKGVRFRLDRPAHDGDEHAPSLRAPSFAALAAMAQAVSLPPEFPLEPARADAPSVDALASLTGTGSLPADAGLGEIAEELLRRLCRVTGAAGGAPVIREGDGRGPRA